MIILLILCLCMECFTSSSCYNIENANKISLENLVKKKIEKITPQSNNQKGVRAAINEIRASLTSLKHKQPSSTVSISNRSSKIYLHKPR